MKFSVRKLAIAGVLGAFSLVMGYIPFLGFIPVPTPAGHATIMHVPAILAGVVAGPVTGMAVGLIFGLLSFFQVAGPSPLFADPLLSILPRLFIGVTAAYAFHGLRRWGLATGLIGAAIIGTATNTVLVLGMAVVRGYMTGKVAVGLGLLHGVPEVVVAVLVVALVGAALARAGLLRLPSRFDKEKL